VHYKKKINGRYAVCILNGGFLMGQRKYSLEKSCVHKNLRSQTIKISRQSKKFRGRCCTKKGKEQWADDPRKATDTSIDDPDMGLVQRRGSRRDGKLKVHLVYQTKRDIPGKTEGRGEPIRVTGGLH